MHFDLWDVETNKYLGHYEDESDALDLVRTLVAHYGSAYADDLELGAITPEGETLEPLTGAALIARVEDILTPRKTASRRSVGGGAKGAHRRSTNEEALASPASEPRKRLSAASTRRSPDR